MSLLTMTDEEQNELAQLERGIDHLYQEECSEGTSEIVSHERDEHFMKLGRLQLKQEIHDALKNEQSHDFIGDKEIVRKITELLRSQSLTDMRERLIKEEEERQRLSLLEQCQQAARELDEENRRLRLMEEYRKDQEKVDSHGMAVIEGESVDDWLKRYLKHKKRQKL
jgi:hypothetical protein